MGVLVFGVDVRYGCLAITCSAGIKYPNPSIIELKLLLANNRFYQKLAFGMFVQCFTAGILAGCSGESMESKTWRSLRLLECY